MLDKQHDNKGLKIRNDIKYPGNSITGWISLEVDSKEMVDFAKLFTLRESRRAPDRALSRVRGNTLQFHPFRLGSEALRLLQR